MRLCDYLHCMSWLGGLGAWRAPGRIHGGILLHLERDEGQNDLKDLRSNLWTVHQREWSGILDERLIYDEILL